MALKNKDLLFIIKVRNQAKAALGQLKGDLRGVGQAGEAGAKGITAQERALDRLKKKAQETARALQQISRAGSGGARGGSATGGRGTAGGGTSRGSSDLAALARSARQAAASLDRVAKARGARGGGGAAGGSAETNLRGLASSANRAAAALDRIAKARPPASGGGAAGAAGAAAGAIGGRGGLGLGAVLGLGAATAAITTYAKLSDEYKNLYARISLTTQGVEDQEKTFGRVVQIANQTRNGLEGTVSTYYRLSQAGKSLGLEQEKVFRATELVSKAVTISGASSEAAKGALIQLGQGLGSGTLRGEELNSVLEQTPRLAEALAEGLGLKSTAALRKFAQEGKLTSEQVIQALLSQGDILDKEFSQFPVTIGQAFTVLRTSFTVAIGEIEKSTGVTAGIATAIQNIGIALNDPEILAGLKSIVSVVGNVALIVTNTLITAFKLFIALLPAIKVGLVLLAVSFVQTKLAAQDSGKSIEDFVKRTATSVRGIATSAVGGVKSIFAAMATSAGVLTGKTKVSFDGIATAAKRSMAGVRTAINGAFGVLGAVIGLMLVFSDTTVQVAGEQTTFGDIVAETWSQFIGWIESTLNTLSVAWDQIASFFGFTSDEGSNTASTLTDVFGKAANFIIATFLTVGQTIGIILGQIVANIVKVGTALVRLASGDFAGAAQAAGSVKGPGEIAQDIASNAVRNYNTDRTGGIFRGAAERTRRNKTAPIGGIGRPPQGGADPSSGSKGGKAGQQAKELADRLGQLQGTYDPLIAKTKEFDDTMAFLNKTMGLGDARLKAMGFSADQVQRIIEGVKRRREEELDIMFESNRAYEDEIRLLGVSADAREDEQKIIELERKARDLGIRDITRETAALRVQLAELKKRRALDAARTQVNDAKAANDNELAGLGLIGEARTRAVELEKFVSDLRRANNGILTEEGMRLAQNLALEQQRSAVIAARNDLTDRLVGLDTEIRLAGVLEKSRERQNALLEYENYLRDQNLLGTEEGIRLMNTYREAVDAATAAEAAARADWRSGIREGLQELTENWSNFRDQARGFVTDTFQSLSDSLTGFLTTGQLNIRSFVQGIGQSLIKIGVNGLLSNVTKGLDGLFGNKGEIAGKPTSILDRYLLGNKAIPVVIQNVGALGALGGTGGGLGGLLQPGAANDNTGGVAGGIQQVAANFTSGLDSNLSNIVAATSQIGTGFASGFGGVLDSILGAIGGAGGGGGGIGGLLSLGLSLFKDGGVMTEHGKLPLRKYSGGGIANSPQLAMFGEGSTPEAYVPVPTGRIPVEMKGGGGGTMNNINVTVHANDANSFRKSQGQIAAEMGAEIARQSRRNN